MKKQLKNKMVEVTLDNGCKVVILGKEALNWQCYTQIPMKTSRKCVERVHSRLRDLSVNSKSVVMNSLSTKRDREVADDKPYVFEIKNQLEENQNYLEQIL